jgi:hypothetical protein
MPKDPGCNCSPRPPTVCDTVNFVEPGNASQSFHFLDRFCQRQISRWPGIWPTQRKEKIRVRCSSPNTFDSHQLLPNLIVVQGLENAEIQVTRYHCLSDTPDVGGLLTTETDLS